MGEQGLEATMDIYRGCWSESLSSLICHLDI